MPLRVDNVRQASIGTIAKMNDTLRNASHASAFATYRRMKYMVSAWNECKELDVRAQAFQLISIFNWKLDRECIDGGVTGPSRHPRFESLCA
jgi:hypothetical protein